MDTADSKRGRKKKSESPAAEGESSKMDIVDKSGPFMSLILHRLDLNNLPRVTSENKNKDDDTGGSEVDEVDDVQILSDDSNGDGGKDEGSEYESEGSGIQGTRRSGRLSKKNKKSMKVSDSESEDQTSSERGRALRSRKRKKEETDESDSDDIIVVRRSGRRSGTKKIDYAEKPLRDTKSDLEDRVSSSDSSSGNSGGTGKDTDVNTNSCGSEKSGSKKKKKFSHKKSMKEQHQDYCCVCKDGGDLLCCDSCIYVYHLSCHDPPLTSMPKGSWKCSVCSMEPLDKVDRILTWRTKGYGREFFVHFLGKSYWECRWVPATQLQVFQPMLIMCYYKKHGKHEPPNLDEGDARRARKNQQDPLERRFYQFGVRSEWLRIDRVIDHRTEKDGRVSYLVKWEQLGYESVTWEDERSCEEIASDFKKATRIYHEWLSYIWGHPGIKTGEKPFVYKYVTIPPKKPTSNLKIKLKKQPDYIPKGMNLHDYQLDGLNWLRYSWAKGINTILGDEMGLGKTIQAIVFLKSLYREGHCKGPFLISAPLSTLLNWEREFQAWAPEMYVVTYSGNEATRLLIRQTEFVQDSSSMTKQNKRIQSQVKFHVLLTSYQFPSMDSASLKSIPWEMIIIDEGHRLKSDGSLFFKDLMQYSTSYKLLLTGTPLQNNLEELFNLLHFLCPEKFDDVSKFVTEFEEIAKADQIKKLHSLLGPHLLRRMKADVLKDMPSKSELIVRVELSPMQKQYSKHILTRNFKALNAKGGRHTSMLNIFMDLRKVCNHPYLFSKACAEAPEDPETGLYELKALTESSGKLLMLRKMLELLKKQGHRVLIFSQMTTMLDILEEFLEGLGYSYERIDGNIMGSVRQDSIDRFNAEGAEQFVFLLSTKAGGLGINLATADTVIIYDSDWNPHNDIQAFSRAHRIGQKNKVMIFRFVTRRSVEEKMMEACKKKMMLTHLVVRPEVGKTMFSKNELEDIIRFGTEELFKDKDANALIHYTDAHIESILDRTKEEPKESSDWMNDYFQGFKVASCEVQEESQPDQEESKDPDQWKYLLQQEIKKKEEDKNDLTNYGKGKRKRPAANHYCEGANAQQDSEAKNKNIARPKPPVQHLNATMHFNPNTLSWNRPMYMYQNGRPYLVQANVNNMNPRMNFQPSIRYSYPTTTTQANVNNANPTMNLQPNMRYPYQTMQMQPSMPYTNRPVQMQPNSRFISPAPQSQSGILAMQLRPSGYPVNPTMRFQPNMQNPFQDIQMQPNTHHINQATPIHPITSVADRLIKLQGNRIAPETHAKDGTSTPTSSYGTSVSDSSESEIDSEVECIEVTPTTPSKTQTPVKMQTPSQTKTPSKMQTTSQRQTPSKIQILQSIMQSVNQQLSLKVSDTSRLNPVNSPVLALPTSSNVSVSVDLNPTPVTPKVEERVEKRPKANIAKKSTSRPPATQSGVTTVRNNSQSISEGRKSESLRARNKRSDVICIDLD